MPEDTLPFPTEENPPLTDEAQSGELDHSQADDDSWSNIEEPPAGETVEVSQADAEPGPDHPSDPATVPIQPQPKLSEFVALSAEEMAEKGKILAKKLVAIEGLEEERKDINHQIKDLETEVVKLRNALISGTIEVMTEQTDLLRQPVGGQAAAEAFTEMARDAEQASQEGAAAVQGDDQAVAELNQMAADIQAGVPGTEPSEAFQNDIENFKAEKAAKRKGKK